VKAQFLDMQRLVGFLIKNKNTTKKKVRGQKA
jgi:hypothetical protein